MINQRRKNQAGIQCENCDEYNIGQNKKNIRDIR